MITIPNNFRFNSIKKIIYISLLLFFVSIGLFFQFKPFISSVYSYSKKQILLLYLGESNYIEKVRLSQVNIDFNNDYKQRTVETTLLPLSISEYKLGGISTTFPAGGGALEIINSQIVIMSRFGEFYVFNTNKLERADIKAVPNNIDSHILYRATKPTIDVMRAHDFVYDRFSNRLYATYTKYIDKEKNVFCVSYINLDKNSLKSVGDWTEIFVSSPINESYPALAGGGKIIINNSILYFSVGYADDDSSKSFDIPASQDLNSFFGRIFSYNLKDKTLMTISIGHRNVQGMTFTNNGDLLATEHGPQGGDEINLITNGGNYGWPYSTYGTDYGKYTWHNTSIIASKAFTDPIFSFVPSVALSPIISIQNFHPIWNGDLLAGSLKAQSLYRIKYKDKRVIFSEPIWIGKRIRDIIEFDKSTIILLTDDASILFIKTDEVKLTKNTKGAGYNFSPEINRCLNCHHFEQSTPASMAPSLANIWNRKAGADSFENYSIGLKNADFLWDENKLRLYLTNPNGLIPGTSMPNLNLKDDEISKIIKTLRN